jgi:hypothetical protein
VAACARGLACQTCPARLRLLLRALGEAVLLQLLLRLSLLLLSRLRGAALPEQVLLLRLLRLSLLRAVRAATASASARVWPICSYKVALFQPMYTKG